MDILRIGERYDSDEKKMKISRGISLFWTLVLVLISTLLQDTKSSLVELGLSITSLTYGGMLGIFIQGRFFENFNDRAALTGVIISVVSIVIIARTTDLFWPWYVPVGFMISFLSGTLLNSLVKER